MSRKPTEPSTQKACTTSNSKMTYKEFVECSIKALREPPYKGIHVVYSNFNNAFRQYYDEDPRPIIDKMVEDGFLVSRPARGGAIIMLAVDTDEKMKKADTDASAVLAKILTQKH